MWTVTCILLLSIVLLSTTYFKVDIATIRAQYRLCGVLTGTLPHLSQQNVFLGVPLVLMPEEVVLLLEIGK